jgi:predicted CXXCH cytochrome family protein
VKKTNYIQKIMTYCSIWFVFWGSLLLPFPKETFFLAEGGPLIEITAPEDNETINSNNVVISGRISSDATPSDQLSIKVYEIVNEVGPRLEITNQGTLTITKPESQDYSEWTFKKDFAEGIHTLAFDVEDAKGNVNSKTVTFTIEESASPSNTGTEEVPSKETAQSAEETQSALAVQDTLSAQAAQASEPEPTGNRPVVTSIELMAYDSMTPEGSVLDLTEPKDGTINEKLTTAFDKLPAETDVPPNENNYLPAEDLTNVRLNSTIRITIKEAGTLQNYSEPLIVLPANETDPSKKVPLNIVPNEAGDKVGDQYVITLSLPQGQTWSPSTTYQAYINPDITNDQGLKIIPKSFKFTTRPAKHSVDIHGNFGNNTNSCANCHSTHNGTNDKLVGGAIQADQGEYFCMACHDGTVASAMPDYDKDNPHFQSHENLKEEGESCVSCHNPHTSWTKENPNKIKNHSVYTYKKSLGLASDFTLCLRCHDGQKASNIKKYYEDETLVYYSGHNITAADGSNSKGQLACADCHETHGNSNSPYSLKGNLGNIKRNADDLFPKEPGKTFTPEKEREFCMKCHSAEKAVEMYGKTAAFDDTLYGHRPKDSGERCSFCHNSVISSDPKEELISAAHAPRRLDE